MSDEHARRTPYQGLAPYTANDAEWFFGRHDWVDIVGDNLRAYRVSILYGESGVGKSSVLQAGLIPRLREEARRNHFEHNAPGLAIAQFSRWSADDPMEALKQAIWHAAGESTGEPGGGPPSGSLVDLLAAAAARVDGVVFVVLDQFEDHFLYHGADDVGHGLEEELTAALRRRSLSASFLISIREDAVAKLDRLQASVPGLLDNLIRMEHLDADAARVAIECPLEHWNELRPDQAMTIERALTEEVLRQVEAGRLAMGDAAGVGRREAQPGSPRVEAPYLQLVLTRLWNEERSAGPAAAPGRCLRDLPRRTRRPDPRLANAVPRGLR